MAITIYNKDGTDSYQLSLGRTEGKIWISHIDGEGGDFNADAVVNVVYEAIDKFYKENF